MVTWKLSASSFEAKSTIPLRRSTASSSRVSSQPTSSESSDTAAITQPERAVHSASCFAACSRSLCANRRYVHPTANIPRLGRARLPALHDMYAGTASDAWERINCS